MSVGDVETLPAGRNVPWGPTLTKWSLDGRSDMATTPVRSGEQRAARHPGLDPTPSLGPFANPYDRICRGSRSRQGKRVVTAAWRTTGHNKHEAPRWRHGTGLRARASVVRTWLGQPMPEGLPDFISWMSVAAGACRLHPRPVWEPQGRMYQPTMATNSPTSATTATCGPCDRALSEPRPRATTNSPNNRARQRTTPTRRAHGIERGRP
jgi:hypothetical protein